MTIAPITDQHPACFGVCCPVHARCARYVAVEGMRNDWTAIANCASHGEQRPLFIDIREVSHAHSGC